MLNQHANIGDKVEVCFIQNKKIYISEIESILDNTKIVIKPPISLEHEVILPVDEVCSLVIWTNDGRYVCDARIIEQTQLDDNIYPSLECISTLKKIQSRQFFRVSCMLPLKFSKIPADSNQLGVSNMFNGIIKDLSGGGIMFVTNESLKLDSFINCVILLDNKYVLCSTKILKKIDLVDDSYKFEYRAMFNNISNTDQDSIIQFIFNTQRKNLQKSVVVD